MRLFTCLLALFLFAPTYAVEKNYDITFKVQGMEGQKALLGYNFLDSKYIQDSIFFDDKGIAHFKGKHDLPEGIYLLAFPALKNRYFEFVLSETSFSMQTDTSDLVKNMVIRNSKENTVMYNDIAYMTAFGKKNGELAKKRDSLPGGSEERKKIEDEMAKLIKDRDETRKNIVKDNPKLLYSRLIRVMTDVEVPDVPEAKTDSFFAFNYLREHYFDNIDPKDSALCRTPILYPAITNYFNSYVFPHPDSINKAIDKIIARFNTGPLMYETVLKSIMRYFAASQIMIHEPVYVHLAKEYFLSGKAPWADSSGLANLRKRVNEILPSMLYTQAPELVIHDTSTTNYYSLYYVLNQEKPDYLVLVFWNSECSHCKKEIPLLSSIYNDSISKLPFKTEVIAVSTDMDVEKAKQFLRETHQENFYTGYEPTGRFKLLYDVQSTPMIFILDKTGKIIAKRIGVENIYGFLQNHHRSAHK